jgi:hypothetical protein
VFVPFQRRFLFLRVEFFFQRNAGHNNITVATEDIHTMDLQGLEWRGIDWIGLIWLGIGTGGWQ